MSRDWVVTGVGMVSAAGDTPGSLFGALIDRVPLLVKQAGTSGGGEAGPAPAIPIRGFVPRHYLDRKGLGNLSRTSQLACAAASRLAAGLAGVPPSDIGVVFGTAWGSLKTVVDFERASYVEGSRFVDPFLFAETVPNVPSGQISIFFGWSACNMTVSSGSASGLAALCTAIDLLEEGRAGLAVAGGGDELNPPLLRTLLAEGKVGANGDSLPFAGRGLGPAGSEGACLIAVEARDQAEARGAATIARVLSHEQRFAGTQGDAGTEPAGLLRALLDRAGLGPRDVDLLVVSASGSEEVDRMEGRALLEVFGPGPSAPLVVAPRAILGETWGASGPLAVVAALEAFAQARVPAPPRDLVPDARFLGLNLPARTIERDVRRAIVLDCAGGGQMAGVLLSRDEAGHAA
ncbi:MAG TPA: beta-ketoacyl synthase N-terminal-like domain-containing protein [Candidatus Polarisedimenticolia bacterium]|jgi:3-oxoacyl-[acyl-carrier-protein] synthase II